MADTVQVPGFGSQKKTTVYVAGGIAVLIAGIVWYRSRSTGSSTAVGTAQIDPATGYPYGSAEDAAALQAQAGYISPGGGGGGGSSVYTGGQQPGGFVSNSQWAQAAEDYLGNTVGSDAIMVSAALGKYLTGGSVTEDQHSIINQAIAFQGYPPVPGPSGYPPSVRVLPPLPPVQGPGTKPPPKGGTFVVPGAFNQRVGLRDVARYLLPANLQSQPNAVESELRRLIAANPGLAGPGKYALGGHLLKRPA